MHAPLTWDDAPLYDGSAWNWARGLGYSFPQGVPFTGREPGYVLFLLGPIYFIFGHSIRAVQFLQAAIGATSVFLIYSIGKRFIGEKAGIVAAAILALWPADIAFSQEILTETLFTFLLLLTIYLFLSAFTNSSPTKFLFGGILLGTTTLTRFTMVLFPLALLVLLIVVFRLNWKSIKYFILLFVGFAMIVVPWTAWASIKADRLVFGRTGSGAIYWSGSYIPWDGNWLGYDVPPLNKFEQGKTENQLDKFLINETIRNIEQNPLGVAGMWIKKPFKVFLNARLAGKSQQTEGFQKIDSINLKFVPIFFSFISVVHLAIIFFGLVGLYLLIKKRETRMVGLMIGGLVLYYAFVLMPVNPDTRYQLSLMPYFMLLAAHCSMVIMNKNIFNLRKYL
jgi:4-amino-4-deoxy-L-arabinose transferase-like glycosyltransferase